MTIVLLFLTVGRNPVLSIVKTGRQLQIIVFSVRIRRNDAFSLCEETMHLPAAVPSQIGIQRLEELDLVVAGSGSVRELTTARTVQPESFHTMYA